MNIHFEDDALDRIDYALHYLPGPYAMLSSFGIQSAVMLDLITRVDPGMTVVFIDTGYLFPQTYEYAWRLRARLRLNLRVYSSVFSPTRMELLFGELWKKGRDGIKLYNYIRKVLPMRAALEELGTKTLFGGARRTQSSTRAELTTFAKQDELWRAYPIVDWTDGQVAHYMNMRALPLHPLAAQGYVSVGDWHSSAPLQPGQRAEDTRFGGLLRECGLNPILRNE